MFDPYRLGCEVRQGRLTSPTIFNLYMDDLIVALSRQHIGCHVDRVCVNNISYADDMLSASISGIRQLVQTCEDYACYHGLKYNVLKSQCMVFEAIGTKCPQNIPPVLLSGVLLKMMEQFKYSGHIVTTCLRDDADIERERRALSVRANLLARRFARCSAQVKITLLEHTTPRFIRVAFGPTIQRKDTVTSLSSTIIHLGYCWGCPDAAAPQAC
ncbi:uncharacterized protein LOC123656159 [Melitaea cinxia]|uniref:uncharacterized protein LOC123656159 n=1 Tax=Melitaea cinxia TaxID=113334 RepID=UPI001E26FBA1|nr:uncharacterized protein LOC123656159 [Melitaea cinxia]